MNLETFSEVDVLHVSADPSSLGLEGFKSALFMNSLCEYGLDGAFPDCVGSAVAVMRQDSLRPVWLAGQWPNVM